MVPLLLLTRPEQASRAFLRELSDELVARVEPLISPLIEVSFGGVLPDLADYDLLIFTSANGVSGFKALGAHFAGKCIAVGDSTADAAKTAGLDVISAQGNADDVIALALTQNPRGRALHVRGEHARGDIAARLTAQGLPTEEAVVYFQHLLPLNAAAVAALSQDRVIVVPLFSPRTAKWFAESTEPSKHIRVIAMSDAVAAEIPKDHLAECHVARAPTRQAMVDGVEAAIIGASTT